MEFVKMHGLGNDFIVIDGKQELPDDVADLAIRLCDRYFGIGADGLVYILPSTVADVKMRIINSDGSEAEQCGNAIRCVAKYVFERGIVPKTELSIETLGAGAQTVQLQLNGERVAAVRVDMGEPILAGRQIPVDLDLPQVVAQPIEVADQTFHFTSVSMGNPHCVIYVEDAVNIDLAYWGPRLETHPLFPNKVNVEFATVHSDSLIDMRVWERGAGPTLACGTGACATLVSSVLNGYTGREAVVRLKGGDLHIVWNELNNRIYMTGPAVEVFSGRVEE